MKQLVAAVTLGFILALPSTTYALLINGTATVDANTSGFGLEIQTQVLGPISLDLAEGVAQTIDLFRIWTNEQLVGLDDIFSQNISVMFDFDTPPPPFGGNIAGETDGIFRFNLAEVSRGEVDSWDPLDIAFGPLGDGLLNISLSEEIFNEGPSCGFFISCPGQLTPGIANGANVQATFLLSETPTSVSEPSTMAIFCLGLTGLYFARRKRSV